MFSAKSAAYGIAPFHAVKPLFDTHALTIGNTGSMYDVSPDGQRFLVNTLADEDAAAPITLVVNWPALLR